MARSAEFWEFFDTQAAPHLALREQTLRQVFTHLDTLTGPVTIVETGCARLAGNWAGDGQSTVLFDQYIRCRDTDSACYTEDISPESVAACRQLVSPRVTVTESDSVAYLGSLAKTLVSTGKHIDLLYLDSFDVDFVHFYPSAVHHLKELTAARIAITERTWVVVDDAPPTGHFVQPSVAQLTPIMPFTVGGKGRLVADYASAVGAQLLFNHYQAGWVGF